MVAGVALHVLATLQDRIGDMPALQSEELSYLASKCGVHIAKMMAL